MGQRAALYAWTASVASSFEVLRRSQAKVLALFAMGIALEQHSALGRIAVALSFLAKPDTVERRLQRFLANGRLDVRVACVALTAWVFRALHEHCTSTAGWDMPSGRVAGG